MRSYGTDWSEQTIAKLRELWESGLSSTKIGCELGVSKNAVLGKVHRLNLTRRHCPIGDKGSRPGPPKSKARIMRPYVPSTTLPKLPSVFRLASIGIGRYEAPVAQVPAASQQLASSPDKDGAPTQPVGAPSFHGECQWIEGDVQVGRETVFCGAPLATRSYCETHSRIVYPLWRRVCEAA